MLVYDRKQISRMQRIFIPALIFTVIVLFGSMDTIMADWTQSEPLEKGKTLTLVLQMLTTGNALLVAPVICAFPYSAAFMDEIRSGMFKNILCRTDKASYIQSKAIACLIAGAMTLMASALLVTLISVILLMPLEASSVVSDAAASGESIQNPLIRQLIGLIFRYGCFGAVWSLVGMLLSIGTLNRLMAWIGPFIVDYLLAILYERYFDGLKLLYPEEWLVMSWNWPLGDWGICLWLILLSGIIFLIVRKTGMRCLEHVV